MSGVFVIHYLPSTKYHILISMIPFTNRFHGHGSLRYVYTNGQVIRSHLATIKYIDNPRRNKSRAAVVVSKKVIKNAVYRNRIRRRIYEYIRPILGENASSLDIVIIVTSGEMLTIPHQELVSQLDKMFSQIQTHKK